MRFLLNLFQLVLQLLYHVFHLFHLCGLSEFVRVVSQDFLKIADTLLVFLILGEQLNLVFF